jgi:AraC-like DNA-binding protein
MGAIADIVGGAANILADPQGRAYHEAFNAGGEKALRAAQRLIAQFSRGEGKPPAGRAGKAPAPAAGVIQVATTTPASSRFLDYFYLMSLPVRPPPSNKGDTQGTVSLVRVALLLRYVNYLENAGAPVDRLLARTRIPATLLDHPGAAIPREHAFRFVEQACRTLGTEHLGLHVGQASLLDGLGAYGEQLQRSLTLHEHFRKAIRLYNMLVTHQHLWLSPVGDEVRFNVATVGDAGIAAYQSHLETIVITIATIRLAAGYDWCPREVSIAYRPRERFPDVDLFAGSRVTTGTGESYCTIPRTLLQRHLRRPRGRTPRHETGTVIAQPLPEDWHGLVRLQVEQLLGDRCLSIASVAESLGMSRRSLQRRLGHQGSTFSQILAETSIRQAADWLANTDKPVAEVAFDLGYRDASNFTRAFRRQTGVSPLRFRQTAGY